MTIAEKVLASHADKKEVKPGEYLWACIDGTNMMLYSPRDMEKYRVQRVFDPDRIYA
ncbi:MAG: hypothetical protein H6Q39_1815, partial [Chloroflexi bacterium]|nr:hypothetical protein [Chloroflexota bacterium]